MSTYDAHGMVAPYKVNRPLNEHEQKHRFSIKKPASQHPHYELSLIRFNSTYVECVDKWYGMRGWVAMGGILTGSALVYGLIGSIRDTLNTYDLIAFLITFGLMGLLGVSLYLLTRDAFTFTHYPIRFNRANRQVYVFRRNGTVLKASWDSICWTIYGHGIGLNEGSVMGHIMADDKKTIQESFALSMTTTANERGEQKLANHFEFFRRYMEDGPAQVLDALRPTPLIMLPALDQHREGFMFGWERLTLNDNGWVLLQSLGQIFLFPESLFRWFAMRTSKIPQWPQWVHDDCPMDPQDPWRRDISTNGNLDGVSPWRFLLYGSVLWAVIGGIGCWGFGLLR
jgi:hypothetical protein